MPDKLKVLSEVISTLIEVNENAIAKCPDLNTDILEYENKAFKTVQRLIENLKD